MIRRAFLPLAALAVLAPLHLATAQFGSHTDTVRNTACKGTDGAWRATH